jgi:hypothetical protein
MNNLREEGIVWVMFWRFSPLLARLLWACGKSEHHGRRVWQRTAAHLWWMGAERRKSLGRRHTFKGMAALTYALQLGPLLIAHSVMKSSTGNLVTS